MAIFKSRENLIGLDISASSLKLFEFEDSGRQKSIKAWAQGPLPKGVILNESITDLKTFGYVLKQALDKPQFGRFDHAYFNVALPEPKSFIRVIQIPAMSDTQADAAVPFEAESFIPLPIDQVYLDWQNLGPVGDKLNVLIIATPKEFVEKHLEALDQADIKVSALEVESQALRRAVIGWKTLETALVVDIDTSRSSLIMVEDGQLQFSSTVPIAGMAFTESLAKSLGVSSAKAEEVKKKVGLANTAEYPNVKIALMPVLNNLVAEMKNVLKFHGEHSEKAAQKIILCGGGAKLKSISEILTTEMTSGGDLKVEMANPWVNLGVSNFQAMPDKMAIGFTTAIGLALRPFESE